MTIATSPTDHPPTSPTETRQYPPEIVLIVALQTNGTQLISLSGALSEPCVLQKQHILSRIIREAKSAAEKTQRAIAEFETATTTSGARQQSPAEPIERCVPRYPMDLGGER